MPPSRGSGVDRRRSRNNRTTAAMSPKKSAARSAKQLKAKKTAIKSNQAPRTQNDVFEMLTNYRTPVDGPIRECPQRTRPLPKISDAAKNYNPENQDPLRLNEMFDPWPAIWKEDCTVQRSQCQATAKQGPAKAFEARAANALSQQHLKATITSFARRCIAAGGEWGTSVAHAALRLEDELPPTVGELGKAGAALDRAGALSDRIDAGKAAPGLLELLCVTSDLVKHKKLQAELFMLRGEAARSTILKLPATFVTAREAHCCKVAAMNEVLKPFLDKFRPAADCAKSWDFTTCDWITKAATSKQDDENAERLKVATQQMTTWKTINDRCASNTETFKEEHPEIVAKFEALNKHMTTVLELQPKSCVVLATVLLASSLLAGDSSDHLQAAMVVSKKEYFVDRKDLPEMLLAKFDEALQDTAATESEVAPSDFSGSTVATATDAPLKKKLKKIAK